MSPRADRRHRFDRRARVESGSNTADPAEPLAHHFLALQRTAGNVVVRLVRAYFAVRYPLASRHLVHYLEGSGSPFIEDVPGLFAANPRGAARVAEQIRGRGGAVRPVDRAYHRYGGDSAEGLPQRGLAAVAGWPVFACVTHDCRASRQCLYRVSPPNFLVAPVPALRSRLWAYSPCGLSIQPSVRVATSTRHAF